MRHEPEVKSFALTSLMAGDSYRKTQGNIAERFKTEVSVSTLHQWLHEDPQRAQALAEQRLQLQLERDLQVVAIAQDLLEDRLENETDLYKINAVKGTAQDKVLATLRLVQDKRHQNALVEALARIAQLPQHEVSKLAAPVMQDLNAP